MAKYKGELQTDNGDILHPHTSSDVVFSEDGTTVSKQIADLSQAVEDIDVSWEGVTNKPTTFPPADHNHSFENLWGKWRDARSEGNKPPSWYNGKGFVVELVDCTQVAYSGGGLATLVTFSAWSDSSGGYFQELHVTADTILRRVNNGTTGWHGWYRPSAGNADTVGGLQAWQMGTLNASGAPHGTSFRLQCQYNKNQDGRFHMFIDGGGHTVSVEYARVASTSTNAQLASEQGNFQGRLRNSWISTNNPSGGAHGEVWMKYS